MIYRTYDIQINNKTISLRLPIRSQLSLCKKYNIDKNQIMTLFYSGMDDPAIMIDIFEAAASYPGNENGITAGADIYDGLVDAGYSSQAEFVPVLTGIANASGFLTAKQKEIIDKLSEEPEITTEEAVAKIKEATQETDQDQDQGKN